MSSEVITSKHRTSSFVNSMFLYLLSFIIVYSINLFSTFIASVIWDVEVTIRNFRVEFLIGPQSEKWTIDSIVFIFLSAPFVSLILAGLVSRLRIIFRGENSYLNLFLIWTFYHSMAFSLGAFVSAVISRELLWHSIAWIGIPILFQYLISLGFIIILYFVGLTTSLNFFESCVYPYPSNKYNRQSWLLNSALKPWIVGSVIILIAFIPDIRDYELYILISILVMIVPLFLRSKLTPEVYVYEEIKKPTIMWLIGVIALFLFFAVRFLV